MTLVKIQKNCLTAVRSTKKCFSAIWKWKKLFLAILSMTNNVAAIWRGKKVGSCYLETKKCSSHMLGARKEIMTCI